jgi:hypothetical protein
MPGASAWGFLFEARQILAGVAQTGNAKAEL